MGYIVERLKEIVAPWSASVAPLPRDIAACKEAYDEIEQLRNIRDGLVRMREEDQAEIERLRAALQRIAGWPSGQVYSAGYSPDDAEQMIDVARAALDLHGGDK